jgi:hypothetical protein
LALLPITSLRAEESWVGQKVMAKKSDVQFGDWVGGKQVYFELKGAAYPVFAEREGCWLRILGFDAPMWRRPLGRRDSQSPGGRGSAA